MAQCANENTERMERMIQEYSAMVYRLAYAQTRNQTDADDVFQEVFFRYIKKQPVFCEQAHAKAWFIRVTCNCAKKHLGSFWNRHRMSFQDDPQISFSLPEETQLDEALRQLSPTYRTVIHLFYYESYTAEEIGVLLSRKPATVRTQLTRARRLLKRQIEEEI